MNPRSLFASVRILVLGAIASALLVPAAHAGKNANGALIVHTNDAYTYSTQTVCTFGNVGEPPSCEGAITRTDKDSGSVVWLLAAFPAGANPGVAVVYFGIDYDVMNLDPAASYRVCGPAGTVEVPDGDWPYSGRGNSVAFGSPVVGDILFPYYAFKIDDYSGGIGNPWFGTAINPTGGYAAFIDDSNPPLLDPCTRFGHVSWRAQGANDCPTAVPQACCFPGGACTEVLATDCLAQGGTPHDLGIGCDPNPCPLPCCFQNGTCAVLDRAACTADGGISDTTHASCEPNPCIQPPPGACCFGAFDCIIMNEPDCLGLNGSWYASSDCDPNPCPQEPLGACCSPGGICYLMNRWPCESIHFTWKGPGTSCSPSPCSAGSEKTSSPRHLEVSWGRLRMLFR